jgi:hypothetical protein
LGEVNDERITGAQIRFFGLIGSDWVGLGRIREWGKLKERRIWPNELSFCISLRMGADKKFGGKNDALLQGKGHARK